MNKQNLGLAILLIAIASGGIMATQQFFANQQMNDELVPVHAEMVPEVNVELINTKGKKVGHATLSETDEGVEIELTIKGVERGIKAIHFHEFGLCTPPSFESAGGHFNPFGKEHGFNNPKGFHAGDLPNIEIKRRGKNEFEIIAPLVTLMPGYENSLLDEDGSALMIHENPDDYVTDPAGNAGKRIVCGEIKR